MIQGMVSSKSHDKQDKGKRKQEKKLQSEYFNE